jgi:hypothetical protein
MTSLRSSFDDLVFGSVIQASVSKAGSMRDKPLNAAAKRPVGLIPTVSERRSPRSTMSSQEQGPEQRYDENELGRYAPARAQNARAGLKNQCC